MSPQNIADVMLDEELLHSLRMQLLADPEFHRGNEIALKQEEEGLTISLQELHERFGRN